MSNFNYNFVQLAGRLTNEPQLKTTPSGVSVAQFSIAVNRGNKQEQNNVDFFNVVTWRSTAEFVSKYFDKGYAIFLTGKILNKSWKDQNGVKHFSVVIQAENAYFVDSKSDVSSASATSEPQLAPLDPDVPLPF